MAPFSFKYKENHFANYSIKKGKKKKERKKKNLRQCRDISYQECFWIGLEIKRTKFSYNINWATILLNIINITTYLKNLTVGLHVLLLLIHTKFYVNKILFTL